MAALEKGYALERKAAGLNFSSESTRNKAEALIREQLVNTIQQDASGAKQTLGAETRVQKHPWHAAKLALFAKASPTRGGGKTVRF